jgi:putative DNA primase/helicase
MTIIKNHDTYTSKGWAVVPLRPNKKKPAIRDWETLAPSSSRTKHMLKDNSNIGIVLGDNSGGLVDIDLDCNEAVRMASDFLPDTGLKFGRDSAPESHWVYQVDEPGGITQYSSPGNGMIAEYRANGGQTMFPPSIHPSGEIVRFDEEGDPLLIGRDDLLGSVAMLAAASLIAQLWVSGSRHNISLALSGWLLRNNWSEDEVIHLVIAISKATGDEEIEDRIRAISSTQERIEAGADVAGWPTLAELIGESAAKTIAKWLGLDGDQQLAKIGHNGPPPSNGPLAFSDIEMARHFVEDHKEDLRYCGESNTWYHWTGTRWERDISLAIDKLSEVTIRRVVAEAKNGNINLSAIGNKQRMNGMTGHAQHQLMVSINKFDTYPNLLNCENGTVDLSTGELRPHSRSDFLTKTTGVEYNPSAECPRFMEFLGRIMGDDEELQAYLQKAIGYALTGDTSQDVLFIAYGDGANGKSTLLNTVREMLGDFGLQTPIQTLLKGSRGGSDASPDVARLKGARFALASEPDDGNSLSEGLIKQLTGGDRITARHLRQEFIEFDPECKIWIQTNHLPAISGTDAGIWRRIHVIPFAVSIPPQEMKRNLANELKEEFPGILAWAVQGCLEWQRDGLERPDSVRNAVNAYQRQNDGVPVFLEERVTKEKGRVLKASGMYEEYNYWANQEGYPQLSHNQLTPRLKKAGLEPGKNKAGRHWKDVRLRDTIEDQFEDTFENKKLAS